MGARFLEDGRMVTGRHTAFSNNKKIVTILLKELENKESSAHEAHAAEDQKQYEFPARKNHKRSGHVNCF